MRELLGIPSHSPRVRAKTGEYPWDRRTFSAMAGTGVRLHIVVGLSTFGYPKMWFGSSTSGFVPK